MGVLETLFSALAPGVAVKRQALREVRAYQRRSASRMFYDGATRGHRASAWRPVNTDSNAEIKASGQRLRDVARDLIRNNSWARKGRDTIVANTIGAGIIPTAHEGSERLVKALEQLMVDHFDTPAIDAAGLHNLYGLQALVLSTVVESGECFVRYRQRRPSDGLPMPFQLEVLEPDYLDTRVDGELTGGNFAVQGIEYNRIGKVEAYHMFAVHPGDTSRTTQLDSRRIPADLVAHVYRVDRPGQARGVSWLAPVMVRLHDLNDYTDASLMRMKIASCFAAFVHTDGFEGQLAAGEETGEAKQPLEWIEPGMIERLRPGEQVTLGGPTQFNDQMFRRQVLLEIAAGLGVSYEALTGDLSGVNFSSGRMGWLEFQRSIEQWRERMIMPQLLWPIEQWFRRNAAVSGLRGQLETVKIKWTPPRREMISPKDEITPLGDAVRAGFMTRSEVIRKLGYDPLVVDAEFAEEFERMDELELKFDTDMRVAAPAPGEEILPGEEPSEGDDEDEGADQEGADDAEQES